MNKCKYTSMNFKCDESALDGYGLCALHIPFSGIANDDKKLNDLKNSAISQKIGNNDYDFSGAILKNLDLFPSDFGGQLAGKNIENDIYIENAEIIDRFTLTGATVIGFIHIKNSRLGVLDCENCNIKSNIDIKKSSMRLSTFYKTKIEGSFQLDECTVDDTIVLSDSKIDREIIVKNSNTKGISFSDGETSSWLCLENTNICGDLSFWRCKVKSIEMTNLFIAGNVFLDSAEICNSVTLKTINISEKFNCYGIKFVNPNKKKNIENQIEIFQKAKIVCSKNGYREDADKHYFYEMQGRRKLKNIFSQLPDICIEKICHYGTKWHPIILWWFSIMFLFALIYYWLSFLNVGGLENSVELRIIKNFSDAIYFSIITITTLGYGDIHPLGITKFFSCLEAIIGTFFWGLFIVVISRKYMR